MLFLRVCHLGMITFPVLFSPKHILHFDFAHKLFGNERTLIVIQVVHVTIG